MRCGRRLTQFRARVVSGRKQVAQAPAGVFFLPEAQRYFFFFAFPAEAARVSSARNFVMRRMSASGIGRSSGNRTEPFAPS